MAAAFGVAAVLVAGIAPGVAARTAPAEPGRDGGAREEWRDVPLPFLKTFEVPKGVTLVRTSVASPGTEVDIKLVNAETKRPRCVAPTSRTWTSTHVGHKSCLALGVVDPPGTEWTLTVASLSGGARTAKSITVEFLRTPLSGPAGKIELHKLSMPRYGLREPDKRFVESFDGTQLYVEVVRPKVDGKVPTILVSSPYNADPASYQNVMTIANDWGPRGYAVVNADVRGFNRAGGCVEVWGPNEQKDQKALIEWIAKQPWSNGDVGMWGKSYVGTTVLEGAVQAPKALKALVVEAPVASAYDDWHFGGVPNGESVLSPIAYQALTGTTRTPGPDGSLLSGIVNAANGLCDSTLTARANDPRSIYDSFYEERDFASLAKKVTAPLLYVHGFEDVNVKTSVYTRFFNGLEVPHLGLFGHFTHIWSPRADAELLYLAWMDQYLMGKDMGLGRLPTAIVQNDRQQQRELPAWPLRDQPRQDFVLDLVSGELEQPRSAPAPTGPGDESAQIVLDGTGAGDRMGSLPTKLTFVHRVREPIELAGLAEVDLRVELAGAQNAHLAAFLYDETDKGRELITFGMANLAHRNGHDSYEPVVPAELVKMPLRFLATDYVFDKGHRIVLEIRAARHSDWELASAGGVSAGAASPSQPGVLTVYAGPQGTRLSFPVLPVSDEPADPLGDWR